MKNNIVKDVNCVDIINNENALNFSITHITIGIPIVNTATIEKNKKTKQNKI